MNFCSIVTNIQKVEKDIDFPMFGSEFQNFQQHKWLKVVTISKINVIFILTLL